MTHFKCIFEILIEFILDVTFCSAMSTNRNREEFAPMTRNRSSSANEASKPILVTQRRQTHVGSKTLNFSPSNGGSSVTGKFLTNINRLKFFPLSTSSLNFSRLKLLPKYESHTKIQPNTNTPPNKQVLFFVLNNHFYYSVLFF